MSARGLLRTGLSLGTRTVPRLSAVVPLAVSCLAVACYLALRAR